MRARAIKKKHACFFARFTCFIFYRLNGNRYKFCNSPSTSSHSNPLRNTSFLNSLALFPLYNRDRVPYPYNFLPIRQSVFRSLNICIAKKASYFSPFPFCYYYTRKLHILQAFPLYKMALPFKKLSKKPLTSIPTFSKQAIKCSGCAMQN